MSIHDQYDAVFKALASPIRRQILDDLKDQPLTTGSLCAHFPDLDRCTVMQHLKVLEGCGLVRSEKIGRTRTYQLAPEPLQLAENWLAEQRALWERRLDQFDAYVMSLKEQEK